MTIREKITGLDPHQIQHLVGAKSEVRLPLPGQDPRWDQNRIDAAIQVAKELGLEVLSFTERINNEDIPMTAILADPKSGNLTEYMTELDRRAPLREIVDNP